MCACVNGMRALVQTLATVDTIHMAHTAAAILMAPTTGGRANRRPAFRTGAAALGTLLLASMGHAQGVRVKESETHLVIPYLARAADDIEFAAAECDITSNGTLMTCRLRQVFITTASFDATACVITTNGYTQTFRRETATRWVSADLESAAGDCGRTETTTLEDGGDTHWTLRIETRTADGVRRAECRASVEPPVVYSWRDVRRKLPCATIQPGAIER